jgi:heme oxygenase
MHNRAQHRESSYAKTGQRGTQFLHRVCRTDAQGVAWVDDQMAVTHRQPGGLAVKVVGVGGKASAPPWMLLRLALETGAHHGKADEDRLAAMSVPSRDEYRRFLARIYGFEQPVERAVAVVLGEASDVARIHSRSHHLRDDLLRLGLTAHRVDILPTCAPTIRTTTEAFGWMFVLVRHSLVAGLVRRELVRRLGDSIAGGTSYLDASSDKAGARLRAFGELVSATATKSSPTAIIAAAQEAFRAQRQWYSSAASSVEADGRGEGPTRGAESVPLSAAPTDG